MTDRELILRKLDLLREYGGQLAEYRGLTAKKYRIDWKVQRIVERTLQLMIETCLDIGQHIIADSGMRTPTSSADIFEVLGENRILSRKTVARIKDMAKFRNLVVHQYERIDPEIVVGIVKRRRGDFRTFEREILKHLPE